MNNNTLEEIGKVILDANKILLYPHINSDGDTIGSCVALCVALRKVGKDCFILMEDKLPDNLEFMNKGYCSDDQNIIENPDISISVDCGDYTRFPKRADKFNEGKISICIDHHKTNKFLCDYNFVDSSAAATGQIIYNLINAMNLEIDKEMGEAIFAAITTDTGNFQYSNTSKETHEIVSKLYESGIDANKVSVEIYESVRPERIKITAKALDTMTILGEGKGAVCYVTQEHLRETGALMEETEDVVQRMRSIKGIEVAAFVKEQNEHTCKISMRSKNFVDVAEIAESFGGGGHVRAAGATLNYPIEQAVELVTEKIIEGLNKI